MTIQTVFFFQPGFLNRAQVDLLLESRADPTRSSETGSFPLQLASFLGFSGDGDGKLGGGCSFTGCTTYLYIYVYMYINVCI